MESPNCESAAKRPRVAQKVTEEELLGTAKLKLASLSGRGNGVVAAVDLPAGWEWKDHPVCVADRCQENAPRRRLPRPDDLDELMREVLEVAADYDGKHTRTCPSDSLEKLPFQKARIWQLVNAPRQMSFVQRHLEIQDTTEENLPDWAKRLNVQPYEYNRLAAQLQSQAVTAT
eukprot:TRINITY_DN43871_c0_g1_i5.p1 TRINITY_DN43871_c0_g1~~TRINITY_DN43871_c0_g1_i5.p1  ORF type:complete len:174 (+),score=43.62 TRINITY_DN43871_c0_g1_i5:461-982(+)